MLLYRLGWLLLLLLLLLDANRLNRRFHHHHATTLLSTILATVRTMEATVHFDIVIEIDLVHVIHIVDHLLLVFVLFLR